jgi:hypothetical protein
LLLVVTLEETQTLAVLQVQTAEVLLTLPMRVTEVQETLLEAQVEEAVSDMEEETLETTDNLALAVQVQI